MCFYTSTRRCLPLLSVFWHRLEKTDLAMSSWHYKEALAEDPEHKEAKERLAVVRELYKKEVCPSLGASVTIQPGSSNLFFPPIFTAPHMCYCLWFLVVL